MRIIPYFDASVNTLIFPPPNYTILKLLSQATILHIVSIASKASTPAPSKK